MYPVPQMPMQVQMQPQRQFGVRDFILAIIYVLVGVAILIGFFGLPLFNRDQLRQLGANSTELEYSASRFIQEMQRELRISSITDIVESSRILEAIAPYYLLYLFVAIAVLYFLGALSAFFKAVFRGGQRIGFFAGLFRIIIVPIFYIIVPLGVMIAFYAFATGVYDLSDIIANPSRFRLDPVQEMMNRLSPGVGMILMVGASIAGAVITVIFTLFGMFSPTRQPVMMQTAYGMPPQYGQYPPAYGQPPYGQYPPQNPYGGQAQYPPSQTPPYQQPPLQNPYGANQPPQNPIDWGKKRDDDDF
jgi:hypothetical protein